MHIWLPPLRLFSAGFIASSLSPSVRSLLFVLLTMLLVALLVAMVTLVGRDESPVRPSQGSLPATHDQFVLIVEDDLDNAWSLALLIPLLFHPDQSPRVIVTHNGWDALEAAERYQPGTVILDIGLPGMCGFTVARALRRLPGMESACLIAHSGYAGQAFENQAWEAGIDHYLLKPCDIEVLRSLLIRPR